LSGALDFLLAPIGGLEKYIKPGMKVLLKPNLLSARVPDRAVTTNPELVYVIASKCLALGAEVIIGDSPGGVEKGLKRVWDNTGMSAIADRAGSNLVSFESGGTRNCTTNGRHYSLSRFAFDVDFIISIPKLKTHVLTTYTGAIKNCFGFVPGLMKSEYHKTNPKPRGFSEVLVDIYSLIKPGLTILDGGLAMEGDGPASGDPRWLGYLFASTDGVAIDTAVASILGIGPDRLLTADIASGRQVGVAALGSIERLGPAFKNGKVPDFKLPSNFIINLIPESLAKFASSFIWARPAINNEICTLCQTCVENCPENVIFEKGGRLEFKYDDCIKCMCCHELCPEKAVYLEKSYIARKIGR
jgi:uncharacterized protein (DUF362 family)/Pyruvate/2-oxoacid:ferredoxin oxidoreductase delta subunit